MKYLQEFKDRVDISTYGPKQIYYSEMFVFFEECQNHHITRIVESGTFMGHSAAVLAKLFPDVEIITYEYRRNRYESARKNLEEFPNVKCVHGMLGPRDYKWNREDAILIDGPKHKDAIKLAQKIVRNGDPAFIAMHDMWKYVNYLTKRFEKVCHSGFPSDEVIALDKNIPYKPEHHNSGFYGCVLAVVR